MKKAVEQGVCLIEITVFTKLKFINLKNKIKCLRTVLCSSHDFHLSLQFAKLISN